MAQTRFTLPASATLDANGNGAAVVTARGDLQVMHTRVTVGPPPGKAATVKQPLVTIYLDGVEFESTHSGANDQSDTAYQLAAQDSVTCEWTGGDPGAVATMYLRGVWL